MTNVKIYKSHFYIFDFNYCTICAHESNTQTNTHTHTHTHTQMNKVIAIDLLKSYPQLIFMQSISVNKRAKMVLGPSL